MSSKYDAERRGAAEDIRDAGGIITLKRTTASLAADYDPLSGVTTPAAGGPVLEEEAYALVLPPTTQTEQTYQTQFASGELRRSDVRKLMIANAKVGDLNSLLDFPPDEGLIAVFEGYEWTFLGLSTQNPDGGDAIFFDTTVKR